MACTLSRTIVSDGYSVHYVAVHYTAAAQGRVSVVTHYHKSLGPLSKDGTHHVMILRH